MLSTMLHSIATGNLLPSWVKTICVDINPAVVTKLMDRGTSQALGIVTDVGVFLPMLVEELEKLEIENKKEEDRGGEDENWIFKRLNKKRDFNYLSIKKIQSKGGLTSFAKGSNESKMVTRAVRIKATPTSNSSFKPQLGKYEFIVRWK